MRSWVQIPSGALVSGKRCFRQHIKESNYGEREI
jgi:hypothetical protein